MEIIDREPRTKQRKIILKKDNISRDVDSLSYKLADTVAEGATKDAISSDLMRFLTELLSDVSLTAESRNYSRDLSSALKILRWRLPMMILI